MMKILQPLNLSVFQVPNHIPTVYFLSCESFHKKLVCFFAMNCKELLGSCPENQPGCLIPFDMFKLYSFSLFVSLYLCIK